MKTIFQYRYKDIDLKDINIPDYIVRDLGEEELDSLRQSIVRHTLLQPLIVNELDDGTIDLIGGSRRLTALGREHYDKAPCKVYNVSEETARLMSIADNIHRKDYGIKELATIYDNLVKECDGNIDEAAKLISKKPAEIKRVLQAQSLRDDILEQTKGIQDKRTRDTVEQLLPTLAKDDRKKAAIQIIKKRNADEFDAKKIIKAIRDNPTEEPQAAVDREFDVPNLVGLQVKLTIGINKALGVAGIKNGVPRATLAATYIERGLMKDGHL